MQKDFYIPSAIPGSPVLLILLQILLLALMTVIIVVIVFVFIINKYPICLLDTRLNLKLSVELRIYKSTRGPGHGFVHQ